MDILSCFDNEIAVPNMTNLDELNNVMIESKFLDDAGRVKVINELSRSCPNFNVGIKKTLTNIETARHDEDPVNEIVELMAQSAWLSCVLYVQSIFPLPLLTFVQATYDE